MTKLFLSLVLLAVVAGLFLFRSQQREQLQRLEGAKAIAEEATAHAAQADELSARLKREMLKLQAEELLRPRATSAGNTNAPTEHPAAKLFRDPEMRAAMQKQNEKAAEHSAKQLVNSNLIGQLRLSPEQAAVLRELARKKHAPGFQMTMALMSGELSDAELAEAGRAMRDQRAAADAEIRTFLGKDDYATFAWHEDSGAERSRIKEFHAKLSESGAPLSSDQEDALLRAMYDERLATPFTHDFHNPHTFDMDRLPEIYSEASLHQFISEMEQMNTRIIQRAQSLLTAEQSGEFAQSLRDHFEKSKTTIKMTAAFFPVRRKN